MENSRIAWTDHTFNPWVGCEAVSEGCENCYAADISKRWGKDFSERIRTSDDYWSKPVKWAKQARETGRPARVFCGSMCDVFDPTVDNAWLGRLAELTTSTPGLIWMFLTKRPELIAGRILELTDGHTDQAADCFGDSLWLGATTENQERLTERLPHLRRQDVPVRFLSCEPLLSELHWVDFAWAGIHWVIVGCEKRGNRPLRPMKELWLKRLVAGVRSRVFVKQMCVDGVVTDDVDRFPEWARVRNVPRVKC